jgi:hypothetical protein
VNPPLAPDVYNDVYKGYSGRVSREAFAFSKEGPVR